MSFDQSQVTDVTVAVSTADLLISWTTTAPAGTLYQVYLNRVLSWHGTALRVILPHPTYKVHVDVGTVGTSEANIDYSAMLPLPPGGGDKITLDWVGGSFLGANIAGYHVYLSSTPGGAIDYAKIVDTVVAYTPGIRTDGYGMGGYGSGGYGAAAATYSWTSKPLSGGTWNVGIKPFDTSGNEGTAMIDSATIYGPPQVMPFFSNRRRLRYAYAATYTAPVGYGSAGYGVGGYGEGNGGSNALPTVQLTWLASPGY